MKKKELRKLYLEKRLALSSVAYNGLNRRLLKQFQKIDFTYINCLHLFLPITKKREPDSLLLIDWLKNAHPEIKLCYPAANFVTSTMQHFADDDELILTGNAFGIQEPLTGNEVQVAEIDMVIVPLLAFDKRGYRAGYGKGFYDRFMAQCNPGTLFTGLSFFDPVNKIEDVDAFDIPLQKCITPDKIWSF